MKLTMQHSLRALAATALMTLCLSSALAQGHEATIRKNLSERIPQIPKIEEITPTPLAGIYELRLSTNEI
jgi:thiol:disulfide interchange protein DsbC